MDRVGAIVAYGENQCIDKILLVRLPAEKLEKIGQEAGERGTTPSALSRIWIWDTLPSPNRKRPRCER